MSCFSRNWKTSLLSRSKRHQWDLFWPHPHWTRRERPSKFGRKNPDVATGLFTLHAISNTWCNKQSGIWLNLFASSVDEALAAGSFAHFRKGALCVVIECVISVWHVVNFRKVAQNLLGLRQWNQKLSFRLQIKVCRYCGTLRCASFCQQCAASVGRAA